MQVRCKIYSSKPPLSESLTAKHLQQDWVPPSSCEVVIEKMKNKMTYPACHPRDKGQGGSSKEDRHIQPSSSEDSESPPLTKKTRSACRTIPSTNPPQFENLTTTRTNCVADKTPTVDDGAAGTSVTPPPEVPISATVSPPSATVSPPRSSTDANGYVPINKPNISYVYTSWKIKAPVVPPSPSTEPVSPTGMSASSGEDGGAPAQSFITSPAPEKVNPGREELAPSHPSASSTTPAAAWP
jgi:hypothetical protein